MSEVTMHALLLATMLSLPMYPLNPTAQDTIPSMTLHVTVGIDGPNGMLTAGPDITTKLEYLFHHPILLRAALDYRFGQIRSVLYPKAALHAAVISTEILYYRGTNKLTGYVGGGLVFATYFMDVYESESDSLLINRGINEVDIGNSLGYRITAGLRYRRVFSIEIGITEIEPQYIYTKRTSPQSYAEAKRPVELNEFRVSFGYLFTLRH